MRIELVHINAEKGSEPYVAMIESIFGRVKRSDTELVHRYASLRRATDTVFGYPVLLNAVSVVHEFAGSAVRGADGAMVLCSGDPGVQEARTLVDIPVVGPWESTVHLAAQYGYRFGILTVEDRSWAELCHALTAKYGLAERCVGVERIVTPSKKAFTEGFADPSGVLADMEQTARRLVDRGANAIVIGSAGLSTIAAYGGLTALPDLGVPIFDALSIGLKTLEMRVDLTQRGGLLPVSRLGMFERYEDSEASRVRHQMGYDGSVTTASASGGTDA